LGSIPARKETTVVVQGRSLSLLQADGEKTLLGTGPVVLRPASDEEGSTIQLRRVPYGVGWWWETAEDRIYEGRLRLGVNEGKLRVISELPLEKYLRGVVPSEIGADSPHEALCAQAIAARSAAVLALTTGIYGGADYDICSDVACQAFSGLTKANAATDAAVAATRGMILEFEGRAVSAYYASNCGGHSEDIRNVWADRAMDRAYWDTARVDGDQPTAPQLQTDAEVEQWLASSPEVWCNPQFAQVPSWSAKNFRWVREFSADQVTSWVANRKPGFGRIVAIRSLKRGLSGRLMEAEFVGELGTYNVGPELAIRQVFIPPLRSAAFVVKSSGAADRPTTFTIRGAGWGHGVGMCQSGAVAMARAGRRHVEILRHYFPRAKVKDVYQPASLPKSVSQVREVRQYF
jgi:SpoIID/LytB domain protein